MVLMGGAEVDNKVIKNKHDKKKTPKTNETDCDIESDSSPSSNVSHHDGTYTPRVPYPQTLDAPFPYRKDKHR